MATAPIGSLTNTTPASTADKSTAKTSNDQMNQDTFLKLLVAQLKYQDPSNPTDSSQFMAQTAQFTLVEKMEALAKSQETLVQSSQLSSATSLVGAQITYLQSGVSQTGIVTGVSISDGTPTLMVGDTKVDLSTVQTVTRAGS
ncbi:flagellar hook capping FlgD N-terminal domain-containing protein [Spongisporangium articulatum]|uniref:Flagellar hook capping FlgD N-terminal domain-containing protein n=1 Tax=Spongisporangium articulatum TaxID=3362603 RepID=A0ABW8AHN8_9ACTN